MYSQQPKHSNLTLPSAQTMQAIAQDINQHYAPEQISHDTQQLILLATDPYHLYAYWRVDEVLASAEKWILRVYWQAEGITDLAQSRLWFDVVLDGEQGQQSVQLPVDGARYTAVLGRRNRQQQFTALIQAATIEIPSHSAKPLTHSAAQLEPSAKTNLRFHPEQPLADKITLVNTQKHYDKTVVDNRIKQLFIQNLKPKQSVIRNHTGQFDEIIIDVLIRQTLAEKGIKFQANKIIPIATTAASHFAASNASGQNNRH